MSCLDSNERIRSKALTGVGRVVVMGVPRSPIGRSRLQRQSGDWRSQGTHEIGVPRDSGDWRSKGVGDHSANQEIGVPRTQEIGVPRTHEIGVPRADREISRLFGRREKLPPPTVGGGSSECYFVSLGGP